ncbi:MAG: nucleotidyltransferase family protein [Clostridia bacterium]|nr:nucleotidyltransferase family protein [Clostridia bacterium]
MHIAIITEYNPFHTGHEYQLSEIRKAFPCACITAIMGGIFSQRGEPYITTPYVRAEAALMCGADLVIELPFPFSCAPANIFARAGVEIAAKIGADILAFGSECGDIEKLKKMLTRLESDEFKAIAESKENSHLSKTRAYAKAYNELYGENCADKPNDILALEYLRAIKKGGYSIKPYTIKRIGDFKSGEDGYASATSIRNDFARCGTQALTDKVPKAAENIYKSSIFGSDIEKLSSAVMLRLIEAGGDIAFSGGGLLNHIKNAARTSSSISELRKNAATKRYTDAEISRFILYALLNVTRSEIDAPVYYTRFFGANAKGCEVLNKTHNIEIITKPSATQTLSDAARTQYEKTFAAERAFALCLDEKYEHLRQTPKVRIS